ncbi:NADP-dependent D-sorbitol-6-phosphate dehydrogenase [Camellia lanceoleosa]|uniref:NADP-dependent D-sorbitol-6-phosphate dehydrogenase n=1 Tax=Camellia lanceoleosa TaxID=1840588 RepID=A0ACC0IPR7_9ERIC|nr:NADP-dependent D-sorbitol-6-phosphate dehydrogenase [Camellia lanceoleosa]
MHTGVGKTESVLGEDGVLGIDNHILGNYLACHGKSGFNGFSSPCWDQGLAEKYKKTVAQIILRWGIQRNTAVIPRTSRIERLEENMQIFDFELAKEDMDLIKSIHRKHRTNPPAKTWGIDIYE